MKMIKIKSLVQERGRCEVDLSRRLWFRHEMVALDKLRLKNGTLIFKINYDKIRTTINDY